MKILVTGGAGFIGSHLVAHLAHQGSEVAALDNLSRAGSELNLDRTAKTLPAVKFFNTDVRDGAEVTRVVRAWRPEVIYHLAAQVAVTTSVTDPKTDFDVNARGTLNVLEAARAVGAAVVLTSTNKVYGEMLDVGVSAAESRYEYASRPFGISEEQPLDFHSPYGCSKGAADQYVLDYARIYGLATVVFRMSCIYGTHQFGNEDQGWLAHFAIAAVLGEELHIYGDGKQVRDVLYVDDLMAAFDCARASLKPGRGQVFNVGGGPDQTVSVWREFGPMLERLIKRPIPVDYREWRPGDQKIYVSDIRKAQRELGWRPRVGVEAGVRRLIEWVSAAAPTGVFSRTRASLGSASATRS